jgi:prepilin-type N-terminal cleavage/methylation domain-containing protein
MSVRVYKRIDVYTCRRTRRRGFSMLEFLVAMTIFGIALAGLFPLLAKYSLHAQRLEKCSAESGRWEQDATKKTWTFLPRDPRYAEFSNNYYNYQKLPSDQTNQYSYPDQWNLVPADDPWMWKLGAAASLVPDDPSGLTVTGGTHRPYFRPFPYAASPTPGPPGLVADTVQADNCYSEGDDMGWIDGLPSVYKGNSRLHASGSTQSWAATWTFTNVQPGWYDIMATWPYPTAAPEPPTDGMAARNTIYQLLDGGGAVLKTSASVDQSVAPVGTSLDNAVWQTIMTAYIKKRDINVNNGDTVRVQIQVPALGSGFITADGMRLVAKTPNNIARPGPLVWSWSSDGQQVTRQVTATVTVTKNSTQ